MCPPGSSRCITARRRSGRAVSRPSTGRSGCADGLTISRSTSRVTDHYPGERPWTFTGGGIHFVAVDVSGEPYVDLERRGRRDDRPRITFSIVAVLLQRVGRRALWRLFGQRLLDLLQFLAMLVVTVGKCGSISISVWTITDRRRDPGEPLAVGGDHVPGRPLRARVREHLGERVLILLPVPRSCTSASENFQFCSGRSRRFRKRVRCSSLDMFRNSFTTPDPVLDQVPLPFVDLAVAPLPQSSPACG